MHERGKHMERRFRLFVWIWLVVAGGCGDKKVTTLFTGQLVDFDEPYVTLTDSYLAHDGLQIPVDKNGRFRYEMRLDGDKDLFLKIGWYFVKVYFRPGDSVHLYADYKNLHRSIHFSGTGTSANNMWQDIARINSKKQQTLRSLVEMNDSFNVDYVINQYRKLKLEKLNHYRNQYRFRFDSPVQKRLTDHLIYTDDWRSYEIYNGRHPDRPVSYVREIPFTWHGAHVKSYTLLQYGVQYFMNRHPQQEIKNLAAVEDFVRDVDSLIDGDPELGESIKLIDLEILLRKNFFNMDYTQCNNLYNEAKSIFRSEAHKERFYDFLEAFFSSVKGGYFPPMRVKNMQCETADLDKTFRLHPLNYLYVFPDLESFNERLNIIKETFKRSDGPVQISILFTRPVNKQLLHALLQKENLPADNHYFLTRRRILHYNYWRNKEPVLFVIDSMLQIRKVTKIPLSPAEE